MARFPQDYSLKWVDRRVARAKVFLFVGGKLSPWSFFRRSPHFTLFHVMRDHGHHAESGMLRKLTACLQLTKPEIMLLVLVTGATGLVMQKDLLNRPWDFGLVMLTLFLTGGSANALNQYFEREIDARMTRTRKRRPLPMGRLKPAEALTFAIGIGLSGVVLLAWRFN